MTTRPTDRPADQPTNGQDVTLPIRFYSGNLLLQVPEAGAEDGWQGGGWDHG